MTTVGVTGANGYLGSLISDAFEAAGWSVVRFVRPRGVTEAGDDRLRRPWELGDPDPRLDGIDVLVHAAWDLKLQKAVDIHHINVAGSIELSRQASHAGVEQFIFISSMSAYDGTQQIYGRAKLAVEEEVLKNGGLVLRPGLVWGPDPRGMAGALLKLFRWRLIPIVARRNLQFPVHQEDLARCVVRLADSGVRGVVGIAQARPVSFEDFLRHLAGRRRVPAMVPIPWPVVYLGLRVAEAAGVGLPFRADSVLGLVRSAGFVPGSLELDRAGGIRRTIGSRACRKRRLSWSRFGR
jgi:nucleoside-diphosphate-sugar epimerase